MTSSSRRNVKVSESVYEQLREEKQDAETWNEFFRRILDQDTGVGSDRIREEVRQVLRDEDIIDPPDMVENKENYDEFVNAVRNAPNQEWIDIYLDWAAKLIDYGGFDKFDERLAMSVRTDENSLPININRRYCLKAYFDRGNGEVGAILPRGSTGIEELKEDATYTMEFSVSGSESDPYYYILPTSFDDFFLEEYEEDWKQAIQNERARGERSPYRDSHNPVAYRAAVDREYRSEILDSVF